ncbi:N-acetyltransferase [Flavobacterium magnum]|uniref:N-acetyltransferase n=1 Tax=Flavobacterium magnum TaxID=2162713 RepID=A0A2S0RB40_9FLAO|nr:GNAT family N-acetyltransferase [Flavobacterium magnum]AWA28893.1 N-acetyltransferase [Flavobacterium magnum]
MCEFVPVTKDNIGDILGMMSDFYAIDGYPIDLKKSASLFETFVADESLGKAWMVYSDTNVAGYVILTTTFSFEYGGKIGFIDELFVKDGFRSNGIGKAAVTFIKEQATKLGLRLLYLEVEQHNTKAQELYLKFGFSTHHRQLMQYKIK